MIQLVLSVSKNAALFSECLSMYTVSSLDYSCQLTQTFVCGCDLRTNLVMIPYGQLSTIKLYICHDSKLVAYEIIEPSLRSKTISVANLDRAFTTYSESKPKVLILLGHILDSSVWQDEFISRDVVNSESILTRLIRISCNHMRS